MNKLLLNVFFMINKFIFCYLSTFINKVVVVFGNSFQRRLFLRLFFVIKCKFRLYLSEMNGLVLTFFNWLQNAIFHFNQKSQEESKNKIEVKYEKTISSIDNYDVHLRPGTENESNFRKF